MTPTLGYWNIRALAQPIRLLLAYTETKFEDKRYNVGPPPNFDRSEWNDEKYSFGLDFPNLPYYIDGDIKLTQSVAILRYLALKNKLNGNDISEQNRINLIEQQIKDFNQAFVDIVYDINFETLKVDYLNRLPDKLKSLSKFLDDRPYFAGNNLTYADFMVYEYLDQQSILAPDIVDKFDNLKRFIKRFETLPTIAKYLASDQYLKWPLNNDSAIFGSRYSKIG